MSRETRGLKSRTSSDWLVGHAAVVHLSSSKQKILESLETECREYLRCCCTTLVYYREFTGCPGPGRPSNRPVLLKSHTSLP